jgi:hypothetical protein
VFAWTPIWAALQTGNVTIPLLVGSALCWRYRDRWKVSAVSGGLTIAAKLLTVWLVPWLLATRRLVGAVGVAVVAVAVSVALWAVLGFSYFSSYPSRVGAINDIESGDSYTLKILLQDLGFGHSVAELAWAAVALAVVLAIVYFGWRGDDRRSFAFAGAAMIFAIPVVWLHSLALLLLPVSVMRPRLSVAWLLPVLCVIGTGSGNGSAMQTLGVLAVAAATVAAAVLPMGVGQSLWTLPSRRRATVAMEASSDSSAA